VKIRLLAAFAACLIGCPPSAPPAPVPPDAADAAPDGPTPCQAACDALAHACGAQAPACVSTMAHIDGTRLVRTPSGNPLTCAAVAACTSAACVRGLGIGCTAEGGP